MAENKKLILLIEDEEFFRQLVATELLDHDFNVIEAVDGKQALELWQKHRPDLVILDILLPQMNGFELMKVIRENVKNNFNNAPVIVLSNLWSREDIDKISKYKIADYLIKAHNSIDDVLARINQVLEKQK